MKSFYCYPIFLVLLTCSQTEGTRLSKVPSAAKSIDNPSLMGTLKRYKKTFCGLGMGALLALLVILIKKYRGKHRYIADEYLKEMLLSIVKLIDDDGTISAPPKEEQLIKAMKKIKYIQFGDKENLIEKEINWATSDEYFVPVLDHLISAIDGKPGKGYLDDIQVLQRLVGIKKQNDNKFIPIDWKKIKEDIPEYPSFEI